MDFKITVKPNGKIPDKVLNALGWLIAYENYVKTHKIPKDDWYWPTETFELFIVAASKSLKYLIHCYFWLFVKLFHYFPEEILPPKERK